MLVSARLAMCPLWLPQKCPTESGFGEHKRHEEELKRAALSFAEPRDDACLVRAVAIDDANRRSVPRKLPWRPGLNLAFGAR